ncbi:tetratricopeptide repeat protein [Wenyingzhuangia sp. IMCC45533]
MIILLLATNLCAQKTKTNRFKNHKVSLKTWFNSDNKKDSTKVYYKNGKINEEFYYDDRELFHGKAFKYTQEGKVMTEWEFFHGKLISREDLNLVYTCKNKEYILAKVKGIEYLNNSIQKNPNNNRLRIARASHRSYLNNLILAEYELNLVRVYLESDNKSTSDYDFRKLLSTCYDSLASVYAKLGDENKSLHYHFEAYQQLPVEGRLVYNLGSSFSQYNYPDLALSYLYKTTSRAPKHTFANWGLARTHLNLGNYNKALTHVEICFNNEETLHKLTTGASDKGIRALRGVINYQLGDYKQAKRYLKQATKIKKDNSYAMYYLSKSYEATHQPSKAKKWLKKAEKNYYFKIFRGHSAAKHVSNLEIITSKRNLLIDLNKHVNQNHKDLSYTLYDLNDNLIKADKSENNTLDLSSVENGLYTLQVETRKELIKFLLAVDIEDTPLVNQLRALAKKHKKRSFRKK